MAKNERSAGFAIDMTMPGMRENVALLVLKHRLKLEISWLKNISGSSPDADMRYTIRRAKEILGIPIKKRMKREQLLKLVETELNSLDNPPNSA